LHYEPQYNNKNIRVFTALIIIIEGSRYVETLQIHLDFLLANLLWRSLIYLGLAIPLFFSNVSIVAGVFLIISSAGYGFCWWRGEKGAVAHAQQHQADQELKEQQQQQQTPSGNNEGVGGAGGVGAAGGETNHEQVDESDSIVPKLEHT